MQQIIGILIFCVIALLLVAAGIYFARGQKPRAQHYGTWSNVLGPQANGQAMDLGERLNREIEAGRRSGGRARRHS